MNTKQLSPVQRREPMVTQVYQSVRQAVLQRRFEPGQRLIETELATLLGVSRTPVREALSKLEAEGLVDPLPAGGVVVRDLDAEIVEIYGLRQRLEGYAANLAAQRITEEELATLDGACQAALAEIDNPSLDRRADLNNTFHQLLTEASHSPRLIRLIDGYRDYLLNQHILQLYDRAIALRQHQQHQEIVEALRQRDGARAEELVRDHFQIALEIIQRSYGPDAQGVSARSEEPTRVDLGGSGGVGSDRPATG